MLFYNPGKDFVFGLCMIQTTRQENNLMRAKQDGPCIHLTCSCISPATPYWVEKEKQRINLRSPVQYELTNMLRTKQRSHREGSLSLELIWSKWKDSSKEVALTESGVSRCKWDQGGPGEPSSQECTKALWQEEHRTLEKLKGERSRWNGKTRWGAAFSKWF